MLSPDRQYSVAMEVANNQLFALSYGNSQVRVFDLDTEKGDNIKVIESAAC